MPPLMIEGLGNLESPHREHNWEYVACRSSVYGCDSATFAEPIGNVSAHQ